MLGRGLKILAHGQEIDVCGAHVVHHLMHFQPLLAQTQHDAGLGEDGGIKPLDRLQQPQRGIVARARTDCRVKARNGLQIVIIDVGPRRDDHLDRPLMLVAEVRRQDFDRRAGRGAAQRLDHLHELRRAAIGQIVAVDRGDDDMFQPHFGGGIGQILRLVDVNLARHPGLDVAKGAGPRAHIAQDHHRRMLLGPAFADVRAGRFLANRIQPLSPHQLAGLMIGRTGRRLHANPVGLAQTLRLGRVTGHGDRSDIVHAPQIAIHGHTCQPRYCAAQTSP